MVIQFLIFDEQPAHQFSSADVYIGSFYLSIFIFMVREALASEYIQSRLEASRTQLKSRAASQPSRLGTLNFFISIILYFLFISM